MITQNFLESVSYKTIGCIYYVHRHLGPGLLEFVYQNMFTQQTPMPRIKSGTISLCANNFQRKESRLPFPTKSPCGKLALTGIKSS